MDGSGGNTTGRAWGIRGGVAAFVVTGAVVFAVLVPFRTLFDTDAYFHLAVAGRYLAQGFGGGLDWARESAMAGQFGDKELLFHVFLMPFIAVSRSTAAGKVALVVLNGAIGVVLARLFAPFLGRWSVLLPLGLALSATDYSSRLLRLRPELVSLPMILLAIVLAARGRHRMLGALACLYALSYTGFHALLLLCILWFAWEVVARRQRPWPLLAWPALGVGLGLVVHPQFPANVRVWVLQGVLRYFVDLPDAGGEMVISASGGSLWHNAAWLLALVVLWRSGAPPSLREGEAAPKDTGDGRLGVYVGLAAAFFLVFYLKLPNRFGLYVVPLVPLALLLEMERRGRRVSHRVRLAGGKSVPLWAGLGACAILGASLLPPVGRAVVANGCFRPDREANARAFGEAVPAGARVAASWGETQWYTFWAPQGRYLNVLDPVFMAVPHPDAYRASLSVFEGEQADVPLVVGTALDSDYLAFLGPIRPDLVERVLADPRLRRVYAGEDVLLEVLPGENQRFFLSWRVAPEGTSPETVSGEDLERWPAYPRYGDERGAALEAFVDQRRVDSGPQCRVFARALGVSTSRRVHWELAPWGSARLWVDRQPVVWVLGETRAVLGQGTIVTLDLDPGSHVVVVESCAAKDGGGFYLLDRDGPPQREARSAQEPDPDSADPPRARDRT